MARLAAGSWIRRPLLIHHRGAWRAGFLRVWFWFFFQKNSPWGSGTSRRGRGKALNPQFPAQDGSKMAQDCLQDASKTAKMASKTPKMASKTAKVASKTAKMAPRCLQDGPRCTQDGLR